MAQHDYNLANQSGADFRADLNNALSAIATTNSGATSPSTTFAHQLWVDTANSVLKIRNSANDAWITTGVSITADNTFDINGGTVNGITSFSFSTGSTVTSILDEDDLSSDSATALATQQSIKAYVDSQVGSVDTLAEILLNGNTTGGTDIAVSTGDDITFADSSKAIFGTGSDLEIYHNGSNSFISESGTGNLQIQAQNLSLEDSTGTRFLLGIQGGETRLYNQGNQKVAIQTTGIDVTGTVTSDGFTAEGDATIKGGSDVSNTGATLQLESTETQAVGSGASISFKGDDGSGTQRVFGVIKGSKTSATSGNFNGGLDFFTRVTAEGNARKRLAIASNGDISFYDDTGTSQNMVWDASADSLNFVDSAAAHFGTGSDLQIYHDGTDSYVRDAGTGDLRLKTNGTGVKIEDGAYTLAFFDAVDNNAKFYKNGNLKLETTGTGIDVTGTVTSDALTVQTAQGDISINNSSSTLNFARAGASYIRATNSLGHFNFITGANNFTNKRLQIASNGDISFYDDTGSTQGLFWDASAERLGLGTTSPAVSIHAQSSTEEANRSLRIAYDGTYYFDLRQKGAGGIVYNAVNASSGGHRWQLDGNEKARIDYSGNFGIGTSSPSTNRRLHVAGVAVKNAKFERTANAKSHIEFSDTTTTVEPSLGSYGNNLTFDTNFQERARIDSSGNFGIGTSSPNAKLHVQSASSDGVIIRTTTNAEPFIALQRNSGSNGVAVLRSIDGGDLRIDTGASGAAQSTRMTIDSSGSVGIGTSSPTNGLLHIQSTSNQISLDTGTAGDGRLHIGHFNAGCFIGTYGDDGGAADNLRFGTHSGDERMRITSTGSVGIGTASPNSKLTVSDATSPVLELNRSGSIGNGWIKSTDSSNNEEAAIQMYNSEFRFYNNGSQNVTITSGGSVGIGTTSPNNKLTVSGASDGINIVGTNSFVRWNSGNMMIRDEGSYAMGFHTYDGSTGQVERMRITSAGNVGIGTNSPSVKLNVLGSNYALTSSGKAINGIHVSGDTNGGAGSYGGAISFGTATGASAITSVQGGSDNDLQGLAFIVHNSGTGSVDAVEAMRVQADGHLLVGTTDATTPGVNAKKVVVGSTTNGDRVAYGLNVIDGATNYRAELFLDDSNATYGLRNAASAGAVAFTISQGSTEQLRVDTSGNLLVGKTGASSGTQGQELRSNGYTVFTRSGGNPLELNRLTSNGTILNFSKDTSVVGKIGTDAGTIYISGGTGSTGLYFGSTNIYPMDAEVVVNNAVDIGHGSYKFRNLYLSGTANVGALTVSNGTNITSIPTTSDRVAFTGASLNYVQSAGNLFIQPTGDLTLNGSGSEIMRLKDGKVGIGTSLPESLLHLSKTDTTTYSATDDNAQRGNGATILLENNTATVDSFGQIAFDSRNSGQGIARIVFLDRGSATTDIAFVTENLDTKAEKMRITGAGNVGIGTDSPSSISNYKILEVQGDTTTTGGIYYTSSSDNSQKAHYYIGGGVGYLGTQTNHPFAFTTNNTERARFDSSGHLLVATTNASNTVAGFRAYTGGNIAATIAGQCAELNRLSSDGSILGFQKDGSTVGSIGTVGGYLGVASGDTGLLFRAPYDDILPYSSTVNLAIDDTIDLGDPSFRFQDIYATNGTIQTSDINEKQDIEDLSDAETRVAVAAKGLLKKYRWKSAVADKGDDARIHFGIMAQDLENAFANEGLDAGDYGMFISTTWTDEATGEEKTRLGVRYNELLAFIIAAI